MINSITSSPFFGLVLSLVVFEIGKYIFQKTQSPLCNPLMIAIVLTILFLEGFHIPLEHYMMGGNYIIFLLGPATVSLAVPLYKNIHLLKKYFVPVMIGGLVGSFVAIVSVVGLGKLLGFDLTLLLSFIPKSITAPLGIEVSNMLGGIPAITIFAILITGVCGNVSAPFICKIFRIKHPVAKGIGIGVASHAVGTSKAMEMGEIEGAMSALSIVIAGILTLLWAPIIKIFL